MKIIDSHIHLQDYETGTNISQIISEAAEAGVIKMVCNGTGVESWQIISDISKKHIEVAPCFGLHPWFIKEAQPNWPDILEDFIKNSTAGVGEIGLDRSDKNTDIKQQEEAFRLQLDIARRYKRPAMIHCVKSWGLMTDILRSEPSLPNGMLFHAYGGSADLVEEFIEMGAYISFTGKVLDENYLRARKSIKNVPLNRLLIETDSPCMLPPNNYIVKAVPTSKGILYNHPANLGLILRGIAELLDINADVLAKQLWENAAIFFSEQNVYWNRISGL